MVRGKGNRGEGLPLPYIEDLDITAWWAHYKSDLELYCVNCERITKHTLRGQAVMGEKVLYLLYECSECNTRKEVSL